MERVSYQDHSRSLTRACRVFGVIALMNSSPVRLGGRRSILAIVRGNRMCAVGWSALVLLFLLLPGLRSGSISGIALAEEKQGAAGTNGQPAELWPGERGGMSPPGSIAPAVRESAESAAGPQVSGQERERGGKKSGEQYLGVFGGPLSVGDTTATYTTQFFFSGPTTTTANIRFNSASVIGVRWGMWGADKYPCLGFAMEFSTVQADGVSGGPGAAPASVDYIAMSLMPMVRLRFFRTESLPSGHLNIYGGIALSFVPSGSVTTYAFEADLKGSGAGGLLGVSLRFSLLDLFAEVRSMNMNLEVDQLFSSGDLTMSTKETVFGAAFRF
jgi:hypothetical protein